jgi:hypothetical protein
MYDGVLTPEYSTAAPDPAMFGCLLTTTATGRTR